MICIVIYKMFLKLLVYQSQLSYKVGWTKQQ